MKRKKTYYRIIWDNGHSCGSFSQKFESKKDAITFARMWKRDMVALEYDSKSKAEARRAYQWDVVPNF